MLPNESLRRAAMAAQPRPAVNNLMTSVERTPGTSEMHSVLARPHSRHLASSKVVRGPAHDAKSALAGNTGTGRSASPPRLKHECAPLPATPPPTRSRSPQQSVRTLGNAIVNPQTVFTSTVERSTQVHAVRSASPSSPQRATRSLPTSPFNKAGDSNRLRNAIAMSDSAANQQQGALVTTTRAHNTDQVEVYGMEALRRGYGTTADALAIYGEAHRMEDLLPAALPAPDLKKLDLRVVVPHYGLQAEVVPKIRLLGDPDIIVEVPHNPDTQRAVAAVCHFSRFVAHCITVEETGLDRALHYHVSVDVPEMFTEAPSIDAATGDLSFVPNPLASGTTKCEMQLLDNATVDVEGRVMRSERIPFVISVQRSNAKGSGLNGDATMGHSTTMGNTTMSSNNASSNGRVFLATQGDFAVTQSPQELLRMRGADTSTTTAGGGEARDAAAQPYVFPPANPHELRYGEVTHVNNLWIAQNPTSNNINGDAVKPALYRPCFDSVLTDVEMVRLGRAAQERDRIIGERVDEARRVELEGKLIERIRQEEKRLGADSVELCPLLLRLAQVYMPQGSKRQGDVVELLERISRIRLRSLGIDNFDQIEALAAQLGGSMGLNGSMAGGGGVVLNASTSGGMLGGMGVLNASIFAQAHAATASLDDASSAASDDAAAQTKESKKFDAFHQSLLLLTLYLKTVGRYREMLDFANYAVTAATVVQGDGSVPYLRALTEAAEGHLLMGNYKEAGPMLAGCVARAEVLFGGDAHATHNLIHMYGTCCAEERDYSKSMAAHDRVLRSRLKHGDPAEQLALAESYLLCAWARVQSGSYATPLQERLVEYHEAALAILITMDKAALSPALSVGRAGLMTLAARISRMRGDNERAQSLLQGIADDVASSRGFESLESAIVSTALAAQRLSQHCEGWTAKRTTTGKDKKANDSHANAADEEVTSSIAALQLANSVLLTVLGAQHPYTVRCATLLAETRMYANAQQSAQVLERCLATVRKLLHPHHRDQVVVHHVASVVHLMTRDNPCALMEAMTAHAVAVELNAHDDMMVELETTLLGALCRNHEPPSGALIALLESRVKSFTMQHGETSELLVTPLQNIAEAFYLLEDFPRAHHFLSRALKIADAVNFIFLLGHLLKPVAQLSVADVQERNRIARDRIHTQLSLKFSEILFQIAAVFDAEGKADDAQSTYLQSLAAQEISGVVAGLSVVEILSALAALLYAEGHFGDALAYAEKGHSILLENFPTMRCVLDAVCDILRVVLFRLRCNGYTLLRHPDSRHRFTTYV